MGFVYVCTAFVSIKVVRPHTTSKIPGKKKFVSRIKQLSYTILVCKADEYLKKGQLLLLVRLKFENPFEIR